MFLLGMVLISMLLFSACANENSNANKTFQPVELFPEPARPAGQKDALELRCEPIDTVRVGFIGLGNRGSRAVKRFTNLDAVKVVAVCDLSDWKIERAQKSLVDKGFPKADEYTGTDGWKKNV